MYKDCQLPQRSFNEVFRSFHSHQRGGAKVALLGDGRLLEGIYKGLQGMCVNERRSITIPPHLGYGSSGAGQQQ